MSMSGMPQARGDVGEPVASFPTYEAAQKAVSSLIAGDVPAREIAIVGTGLRSIERVTGRLGYATAARSGAINGLLLGLFFSAIFVLGNPSVPVSAFVGVLFVGIAFGMLLSIVTYALVRRRRDYASVMQVVADHYDVTVLPSSIHRARQIIGGAASSAPAATAPAVPIPPVPAAPAPPVVPAEPTAEPPRYGERITPAEPTADADGDEPHGEAPEAEDARGDEPTDDPERDPSESAGERPEASGEDEPRPGADRA